MNTILNFIIEIIPHYTFRTNDKTFTVYNFGCSRVKNIKIYANVLNSRDAETPQCPSPTFLYWIPLQLCHARVCKYVMSKIIKHFINVSLIHYFLVRKNNLVRIWAQLTNGIMLDDRRDV